MTQPDRLVLDGSGLWGSCRGGQRQVIRAHPCWGCTVLLGSAPSKASLGMATWKLRGPAQVSEPTASHGEHLVALV